MLNIKAKINQELINNKVNKTIQESGISESRVKVFFDYDTLIMTVMYDDNTVIDEINLTNYIDVEIARI